MSDYIYITKQELHNICNDVMRQLAKEELEYLWDSTTETSHWSMYYFNGVDTALCALEKRLTTDDKEKSES